MRILEEIVGSSFPFKWVRLDNYRDNESYRKEIYLKEGQDIDTGLMNLFDDLFGKVQSGILIFNDSWWNFTLDTWNINEDTYDYDLKNKSEETACYLRMLNESEIPKGYSGSCRCLDWSMFLRVILPCITTYIAPYSPIFYNEQEEFFFYFHHTGSIGIYYRKCNATIIELLEKADQKYLVTE